MGEYWRYNGELGAKNAAWGYAESCTGSYQKSAHNSPEYRPDKRCADVKVKSREFFHLDGGGNGDVRFNRTLFNRTFKYKLKKLNVSICNKNPNRLKCEKDGTFIDDINPGGLIESVRELLAQMSASHVQLYFEAHQADRAAQSLSRALKTLLNNIVAAAEVGRLF